MIGFVNRVEALASLCCSGITSVSVSAEKKNICHGNTEVP